MKIHPKDWFVVLQKPGEVLKHNGQHVHFVFNISSTAANPTGFSMSIGYVINTVPKNDAWIRHDPVVGLSDTNGRVRVVSRNNRPAFIRSMGAKDYTPVQKRVKAASKKGFQLNNTLGRKDK
jgi:hypothetical protein